MPRGLAHDHEAKRAALRKGAAAYFAEHGYDRASMAGAAAACGVATVTQRAKAIVSGLPHTHTHTRTHTHTHTHTGQEPPRSEAACTRNSRKVRQVPPGSDCVQMAGLVDA